MSGLQIVAGLDEGVASMRAGGLRRIYIPGNLSFPKGLASGPGRCVLGTTARFLKVTALTENLHLMEQATLAQLWQTAS